MSYGAPTMDAAADGDYVRFEDLPKWQPIDTAPKDGMPVLLWEPDAGEIFGRFVGDFELGEWWDDEGEIRYPTHWYPLPEPPAV